MPEASPSKWLTQAGWADVPHIDAKTQSELLAATPPYMRESRSKGTPSRGAGAIWTTMEEDFVVKPFPIPDYWPRCYALDVGWNRTACLWGAYDRGVSTWYFYTEHYRSKALPSVHATAIRARGEWIPGLIDPAARGRSQSDGKQLIETYGQLGLSLVPYINAVDAGLDSVWLLLETGRLKVFSTLPYFLFEYRLYHRDEKGEVVKKNDHLLDCCRGIVMSGQSRAKVKPIANRNVIGSAAGGDKDVGF